MEFILPTHKPSHIGELPSDTNTDELAFGEVSVAVLSPRLLLLLTFSLCLLTLGVNLR